MTLFATLPAKFPNYCPSQNVMSDRQWITWAFIITITQLSVHDTALPVQVWDAPRSLHHKMTIRESPFDIHEQFMVAKKPGMCSTVSSRDWEALHPSRWAFKDLIHEQQHEDVHPSSFLILLQSPCTARDDDQHRLRWLRVHIYRNYHDISP